MEVTDESFVKSFLPYISKGWKQQNMSMPETTALGTEATNTSFLLSTTVFYILGFPSGSFFKNYLFSFSATLYVCQCSPEMLSLPKNLNMPIFKS